MQKHNMPFPKILISVRPYPISLHQVLFIDEIQFVEGELLSAFDLVASIFRKCTRPFGGILVVAVGDHYQLDPIDLTSPFMTCLVRYYFKTYVLTQMVRQDGDLEMQALINTIRQPCIPEPEIQASLHFFGQLTTCHTQPSTWLQHHFATQNPGPSGSGGRGAPSTSAGQAGMV